MLSNCLSCKKNTPSVDIEYITNGNRTRMTAICSVCQSKKSLFVRKDGQINEVTGNKYRQKAKASKEQKIGVPPRSHVKRGSGPISSLLKVIGL
jgi:protein-arginine kinase activator protein McsA